MVLDATLRGGDDAAARAAVRQLGRDGARARGGVDCSFSAVKPADPESRRHDVVSASQVRQLVADGAIEEVTRGVFAFDMFTREFCGALIEEARGCRHKSRWS